MNEVKTCPNLCERTTSPVRALIEAHGLAELVRQILPEGTLGDLDGNATFGLEVIMAEIGERLQLALLAVQELPERGEVFPAVAARTSPPPPPGRPVPTVSVVK